MKFVLLLFVVHCFVTPSESDDLSTYGPFKLYGREASKLPSKGGRQFKYLNYRQIIEELKRLAEAYPGLISIYNAQQRWNIASPGNCGAAGACQQWFARITNEETLYRGEKMSEPAEGTTDGTHGENKPTRPDGSPADDYGPPERPDHGGRRTKVRKRVTDRPEVFFSGSVHGNERIGPTATIEMARLLLENYKYGNNEWLKLLVDTRSIFIMPTANALGYYKNVREENGMDPNRDFPYGVAPDMCMRTTAARAINELYREHLFQLALTFHGGMRAISYEWGAPNARKNYSPDDGALLPMGRAMRKYASGNFYPEADAMNPLVYPVKGGMEDWAYASSWDKTPGWVQPCTPKTYIKAAGPYSYKKTVYTSDMLRTLNILIETNTRKAPNSKVLGYVHQVLRPENANGKADGDIPRNIRLQLMMADLVQPYVRWSSGVTNDLLQQFWDKSIADANNRGTKPRTRPFQGDEHIMLSWNIGGALKVDDTALYYGYVFEKFDHTEPIYNRYGVPLSAPCTSAYMQELIHKIFTSKPTYFKRINTDVEKGYKSTSWYNEGSTFKTPGMQINNEGWSSSPLHLDDGTEKSFGLGNGFYADVNPTDMRLEANNWKFDRILVIFAAAKVDSNWNTPSRPSWPVGAKPFSHVVKARNNDKYVATNGESVITGQSHYMSKPLCIVQKRHEWNPNPTTTTTTTTKTTPTPTPTPTPKNDPTKKSTATTATKTTEGERGETKKSGTTATTKQPVSDQTKTTTASPMTSGEKKNTIRTTMNTNTSKSIGTVFILLVIIFTVTCSCLIIVKCTGFGNDDCNDQKNVDMKNSLSKFSNSVKKKVKLQIKRVKEKKIRELDIRESTKKSRRQSGQHSETRKLVVSSTSESEDENEITNKMTEIEMV
jgi:hypothetical protein